MKRFLAALCATLLFWTDASAGVFTSPPRGQSMLLSVKALDFHTATGDVGTIIVPATIARYQISAISITNCSATPILAAVGFFTGAGGTGTTLVTAGTITGATSAVIILPMTLAGTAATTLLTATPLYVRLTVANTGALTCDVGIIVFDWT